MKPLLLVYALAEIGAGRHLARPTTLYSVPAFLGSGGVLYTLATR